MKKQKGITLIALVVTIIVLIILAVISINVVFGDEGILARALEGQEKQKMAEAREEVQLMLTDYVVEREVNNKQLMEYLLEQKEKGALEEVTDNEDGTITVEVDGYNVTIVEETLEVKEEVVRNENAVKITLSANVAEENETIKATISLGNNIDSSKIKWAYTTDETLGTEDETKYPNTLNGNEIELTASIYGTYYLHILVVDKDGNVTEKIAGPINIEKQPVQATANTLIGAYIEYDVEYIDSVYGGSFDFTSTNGWRMLNYEVDANDNTKLNNVEIISTGIPARLYYDYYYSTTNADWWERDTTKLTNFHEDELGGSTYGNNTTSSASMMAAAGLYNNFGSISFAYSSSSRGYNLGYFSNTIKGANGTTYGSSNASPVTGEKLFVIEGVATGVRTLTLPEVNRACNLTFNQTSTALTDTTGLYRLASLKIKNSDGDEVLPYTSSGSYWVASPYPGVGISLCQVFYSGSIGANRYDGLGVRPVVSLGSGIQLVQETDANGDVYYSIK